MKEQQRGPTADRTDFLGDLPALEGVADAPAPGAGERDRTAATTSTAAAEEPVGDLARLADSSDALLAELRALRVAEERKRSTAIASPEFRELANEVEARANRIWRIASAERIEGERIERQVGVASGPQRVPSTADDPESESSPTGT